MTIHDMLNSAATDIRAMEIKVQTLESQLESTERDNERLRKAHAEAEARRIHAEADLVHYQNVFVASVCMESINICKQMFETTHSQVKKRAEDAIQRMVEEKLDKEREQSTANPASDIDEDQDVKRRFQEPEETPLPASFTNPRASQNDTVIQAPEGMSNKEIKLFYKAYLGSVPPNYSQRPVFYMVEGKWYEKNSFPNKDDGKSIPNFLTNREPREDLRGGISKAVLAAFGG